MTIKNVKIFNDKFEFEEGELSFEDGIITKTSSAEEIDGKGLTIIPGLIDLHFHGCNNYEFCDGTAESFLGIAQYEAEHGTTAIAPASITQSEEVLGKAYSIAKEYKDQCAAIFCGINMEGPFFNYEKKGGQNGDFIKNPEIEMYERLQDVSGNMIKIVDVAPELEGSSEFIKEVSKSAVVSIAHTTADYKTAMAAFENGANHVTHLYNAMPPLSHREPGVIGAAADSGAMVELICDGKHVSPPVMRTTFKLFGDDKIVMISDSLRCAGLPEGEYDSGGLKFVVRDGLGYLPDGTIAGSASLLFDCLKCAIKEGIPMESAIKTATYNPAKVLGVLDEMGTLTIGKMANFIMVDDEFNLRGVYIKGKKIV